MFVPQPNTEMTITLPGEMLRAKVIKLVTKNAVIVQISTEPLARLSHNYRNGQIIACRRKKGMFGEEWEAVPAMAMSVEDIEKQEKQHAASTRKLTEDDKQKHQRVNSPRKQTKKS